MQLVQHVDPAEACAYDENVKLADLVSVVHRGFSLGPSTFVCPISLVEPL